jgi:class 3 adenylate cyclase
VPTGSGRATATVLFTDLVGSTELRTRLGEQAAEELRRRHDRLLAEAVADHQGRVIKGLGDGIMATFTGASDGVAAAVAIQQAVDRHNRGGTSPVPLAVRVGLSVGDVTFEDDDVHGTPVIEAARLCNAAASGQILAPETLRWLARSSETVYITVGSLDLKGLPEPLSTVQVEWAPLLGGGRMSGRPYNLVICDSQLSSRSSVGGAPSAGSLRRPVAAPAPRWNPSAILSSSAAASAGGASLSSRSATSVSTDGRGEVFST